MFSLTPELRAALKAERERVRAAGVHPPYVFTYRGRRIGDYRRAWKSACLVARRGTVVSTSPKGWRIPGAPSPTVSGAAPRGTSSGPAGRGPPR